MASKTSKPLWLPGRLKSKMIADGLTQRLDFIARGKPHRLSTIRVPKRQGLSLFEAFSVKLTLNNANPTSRNASESREVLDGAALTG
jgi:hypothetical protein